MTEPKNTLQAPAQVMAVCAVLQLTLWLVAGQSTATFLMAGFGLLGLITAWGLWQAWRWLAYLAFVPVMGVAIWALAGAMQASGLAWVWWSGIALFDGLCWLLLFRALWRHPTT